MIFELLVIVHTRLATGVSVCAVSSPQGPYRALLALLYNKEDNEFQLSLGYYNFTWVLDDGFL